MAGSDPTGPSKKERTVVIAGVALLFLMILALPIAFGMFVYVFNPGGHSTHTVRNVVYNVPGGPSPP